MSKREPASLTVPWWHKLFATGAFILVLLPLAYRFGVVSAAFYPDVLVSPFAGIWLVRLIDVDSSDRVWFPLLDWGIGALMLILLSTHSYLRQKIAWARWTALAGYVAWALNSVVIMILFLPYLPEGMAMVPVLFEVGSLIGAAVFISSLLSPGFTAWLRTPDGPEPLQPVHGRVMVEGLSVHGVSDVSAAEGRPVGELTEYQETSPNAALSTPPGWLPRT